MQNNLKRKAANKAKSSSTSNIDSGSVSENSASNTSSTVENIVNIGYSIDSENVQSSNSNILTRLSPSIQLLSQPLPEYRSSNIRSSDLINMSSTSINAFEEKLLYPDMTSSGPSRLVPYTSSNTNTYKRSFSDTTSGTHYDNYPQHSSSTSPYFHSSYPSVDYKGTTEYNPYAYLQHQYTSNSSSNNSSSSSIPNYNIQTNVSFKNAFEPISYQPDNTRLYDGSYMTHYNTSSNISNNTASGNSNNIYVGNTSSNINNNPQIYSNIPSYMSEVHQTSLSTTNSSSSSSINNNSNSNNFSLPSPQQGDNSYNNYYDYEVQKSKKKKSEHRDKFS